MGEHQRPRCVGLALGGGVVRGMAHVGVLEALEAAGIPIDVVSGTSSGSLIGAFYCAGVPAYEIAAAARRLKWWHIARPVLPWRGLITFAPIERYVRRAIGDLDFGDLRRPFACVATDLDRGEPVTFRSGPLAPAIWASCSVPGIAVPVERDGLVLCDGGISDNLPVAAARALGADFVIGVNLFDPFIARPRHMFTVGFAAIETMVRRAGGGLHSCDVLISPDLLGVSYVRLSKREAMIEKGRLATELQLPRLRAAIFGEEPVVAKPLAEARSDPFVGMGKIGGEGAPGRDEVRRGDVPQGWDEVRRGDVPPGINTPAT